MNKKKIALLFNIVLFILEFIGLAIAIGKNGIIVMGLYTQLSNLVLFIASGIYLYERLVLKRDEISHKAAMWKYISTCLVTVTLVVVLFVFVPMCMPDVNLALYVVFDGASLFHHFICPILALISYFGYESDMIPGLKEALIAMLPTLSYAIVSTSLNVAKIIVGPYPFLYVYEQPVFVSVIWFFAIPGFGFLFAWLVGIIKRKLYGKTNNREQMIL